MASQISRKYDFKPGTRIYSAQVDEELNQLVDAHNSVVIDKAEKDQVITRDNTEEFTPSGNYQPATKKYVDEVAGNVVLGQIPDGTITKEKLNTNLQSEILTVTGDDGKKYKLNVADRGNLYPKDQLTFPIDHILYPGITGDSVNHNGIPYGFERYRTYSVSNGVQSVFLYGDDGYYRFAYYDPAIGFTELPTFVNIPANGTSFRRQICQDKSDQDIIYIVYYDSREISLSLVKMKLSTREIIEDRVITGTISEMNFLVDNGSELVYCITVASGVGSVYSINKTTFVSKLTGFSGNTSLRSYYPPDGSGKMIAITSSGSSSPYSVRFTEIDVTTGSAKVALDTTSLEYTDPFAIYSKKYNHWIFARTTASHVWSMYIWDGSSVTNTATDINATFIQASFLSIAVGDYFYTFYKSEYMYKFSTETGELISVTMQYFVRYNQTGSLLALIPLKDNRRFIIIANYVVFCYDTLTDTIRLLVSPNVWGIPPRGNRLLFLPIPTKDSEFLTGFYQVPYTTDYNWITNLWWDIAGAYVWYDADKTGYVSSIKEVTE